jgi:hypothetical protein
MQPLSWKSVAALLVVGSGTMWIFNNRMAEQKQRTEGKSWIDLFTTEPNHLSLFRISASNKLFFLLFFFVSFDH